MIDAVAGPLPPASGALAMAGAKTCAYRGFTVTVQSTELTSAGWPQARQFNGCFAVASGGEGPVSWSATGAFVFDTRAHARSAASSAARRWIDAYLLAGAR